MTSLYIGYARTTCTTEQVKTVFNDIMDEDIVTTVDERIKKDTHGYDYKMFFVNFSHTNHRLEQMVERISKDGFVDIVYAMEYDKKLGTRVERYWRVYSFTPKPSPPTGIRIMTEEEAPTSNETASAMTSLYIGYARTTCTTEQVKTVFNIVLDEEIVTTVDELVKKDPKGYEFKVFFVHFSHTNHRLEQMVSRIRKEGFVTIVYITEYDKKLGTRVERYWKVRSFTPKPAPPTGIRIMAEEETASLERPKRTKSPKGSKATPKRGGSRKRSRKLSRKR